MMDVVECNTRLALNILILAAAIPLIIAAAIPRRRMPRSMYPSWYNNLWVIRLVGRTLGATGRAGGRMGGLAGRAGQEAGPVSQAGAV